MKVCKHHQIDVGCVDCKCDKLESALAELRVICDGMAERLREPHDAFLHLESTHKILTAYTSFRERDK